MAKDKDLHDRALNRAKYAASVWSKQRKREKSDLKFQVPELQWDEDARAARRGMQDGVPVPARPMLSISLLDQPIQLVNNAMRAAHLGVNVHPLSPDADDEVAEVIQGLYRETERVSRAELARTWAFDRASKCGFGVYRITTKYDDQGGHPFDQVIAIERILDSANIYLDPSAQQPDFSDGKFAVEFQWLPVDAYREEFPDAAVPPGDTSPIVGDSDTDGSMPNWVEVDNGGAVTAVCVLTYWERTCKKETIVALEGGQIAPKDKLPKGAKPVLDDEGQPMERTRENYEVFVSKHTVAGMIEGPSKWPGRYIPLIPVIGSEDQPFDSDRRWTGIIGPAKDSQKAYNYAISQAIESVALEPKAPYIIYEGQVDGYQSMWQQANNRNWPYLVIKPVQVGGNVLPPPSRAQIDTSRMGGALQLAQTFQFGVQSTTSQFDPSLGRGGKEKSGIAISELKEQAEQSNSHYIANLADISMNYEARVVLDLIPVIYDRPGRIAKTLDEEEDQGTVMLNAPFTMDPNSKRPIEANVPPGQPMPQGVKQYALRKGIYSISISIGKSYQSRLQQGADEIGQILQSQPQLLPLIGPLYFRYRDFPGAEQIAEILKKVQAQQMPFLDKPEQGEPPTPEQLQAENDGLKKQMEQMQQQLQSAAQAMQTDQAKQQATLQTAQLKSQTDLQKAQMDNDTKKQIEEIKAQVAILLQQSKGQTENARTGAEMLHEQDLAHQDMAHEVAMESMKQGHAMEQAAAGTLAPTDLNWKGANDTPMGEEDEY